MRFYANDSRTATVQWYFVADGTPVLPFPTVFNNKDWDDWHGAGATLGEDESGARGAWSNGADLWGADGSRGHVCGTADQFINGQPLAPSVPTPVNLAGLPLCCPARPGPFLLICGIPGLSPPDSVPGAAALNGLWALVPDVPSTGNGVQWCYPAASAGQPHFTGLYNVEIVLSNTSNGKDSTCLIGGLMLPGSFWSFGGPPWVFGPDVPLIFGSSSGLEAPPKSVTITKDPTESCDMPVIGFVYPDCGSDAIPSLFLLCDGRAVSRKQYSLLFGRVGVTFGAGDGVNTFNLPDLRGKVLVGSGGSYNTGQAVGNDSPTLSVNQLPSHNHSAFDSGHQHNSVDGTDFLTANASGSTFTAGNARPNIQDSGSSQTATAQASITIGQTGGGAPIDVRQASVAVRPLIYAGQ